MCVSADAADTDDKLHLQACDRAVGTIDADADVDETAPCINLDSSALSLVSHLACFIRCIALIQMNLLARI